MKCPHCLDAIHATAEAVSLGKDADAAWVIQKIHCPSCYRFILSVQEADAEMAGARFAGPGKVRREYLVRPKASGRSPCPAEVPEAIAGDYKEACLVMADSAKASAALSRRCLQNLLRNAGGVKHGDLASEIQQVLDSGKLPTSLAENVDAIRNIGNFAAHPLKSTATGQIIDVEPDEAEWNLDVLEQLFDFYYVAPAVAKKKRDDLNAKLQALGKPPMKQ